MTTPAKALPTGPGGMPGYIWNLPAMPPPEGQASNFVNPESRDMELIVMNAVFLSATVVAVAVRFVARRTAKDVVGWDGGELEKRRKEFVWSCLDTYVA